MGRVSRPTPDVLSQNRQGWGSAKHSLISPPADSSVFWSLRTTGTHNREDFIGFLFRWGPTLTWVCLVEWKVGTAGDWRWAWVQVWERERWGSWRGPAQIPCLSPDRLGFTFPPKGFWVEDFNLIHQFILCVHAKKPRRNIPILNKFNK